MPCAAQSAALHALAATDGGRDMPNKWVGDRFVPRPVVSYGVYEGPARFGRPVEGSGQLEGGDDELRLAFGQGLWGGRLPDDWQVIDAEMYAVLAYLRKMATAEDAADRRCLVLSDCKPALQQIEAAYRKGSLEGLREEVASRGYADIAPSSNLSRSCGYRATRGALATPTPTPWRLHTWGPARLRMPPPSSVKQ